MKTSDIEMSIACMYGWRNHLIVPNVSWGMGLNREIDILVVSNRGYATEIEIKVSLSDLKADKKKRYPHGGKWIKAVYFAVPETMKGYHEHIPLNCGIMIITEPVSGYKYGRCRIERKAINNKAAIPLTAKQGINLASLGTMRYWNLRGNL